MGMRVRPSEVPGAGRGLFAAWHGGLPAGHRIPYTGDEIVLSSDAARRPVRAADEARRRHRCGAPQLWTRPLGERPARRRGRAWASAPGELRVRAAHAARRRRSAHCCSEDTATHCEGGGAARALRRRLLALPRRRDQPAGSGSCSSGAREPLSPQQNWRRLEQARNQRQRRAGAYDRRRPAARQQRLAPDRRKARPERGGAT